MSLLLVLDLVGTLVFAISGAMAGVTRRLDLFGILVLSFVAGNVGGITRDVLIGSVPPAAISDWRYLAVSLLAGVIAFYSYSVVDRLRSPVLVFDAAGLALFVVSGAQKALAFGLNPVMAALLGMLTGVGGGMMRDLLTGRNSHGPADRPLRGRRAGRRCGGGDWEPAAPSADRNDNHWRARRRRRSSARRHFWSLPPSWRRANVRPHRRRLVVNRR
jgi:Glycine transporter